ncbi:ABC transporter permease [Halalkalicoccus jeotgali]|uniref:ABC transporter permease n=1 Tax=Halalkalicoccus jeotgali (strain DSM 18796 / CECT 7217 / JCM 14584 / KCTC 4019 / B3) TaxID=795797 RepID=D8JBA1_HALJB|nr:ABC transporter permease [Halalkalicoccus jeotgali]ADJ16554.1 ABC transporter permease [Halalkalicoccus jeotgali B3]ELY41350.1 ABC transporter permease [Halalkalicoccus jeotgali B3]
MFPTTSRTDAAVDRFDWLSVTFLLGAVLLCYYLVPLLSLIVSQPPGVVLERLRAPEVVSAATTSVTAAVTSTAIATVFGLPLAYWLARVDGRMKTVVTALVILPLVLPPIVSGMVLLTVVGPNTLLGEAAADSGIPLTRSLVGVVLAQTFVASPFVVVTAKTAFEGVDRRLEYASQSLGKSRLTTFRRVTLPLAWSGILAGITLAFARAIGEFGATIMLAYYPRTMPVQIWISFSTLGLENAFPVAAILVGIAIATLVVLNALGTNPLE